jgi:hypothetical protein
MAESKAMRDEYAALRKRLEETRGALEDSTSLMRTIHDEDDEGAIGAQIADNLAALEEKP